MTAGDVVGDAGPAGAAGPTGTVGAAGAHQPRPRLAAIAVLAVALVVRLAGVVATRHLPLKDDSADYHRLALLLAHGHGFGVTVLAAGGGPTAFRAPLYPLFLAVVFRLSGDSVIVARILQAGLGTVTVGLIGVLAWQLFGRRVALVAGAVAAVYPPLILVGNGVLTESLSLPLLLGALVAAVSFRRRKAPLGLAAVAGALSGLAILSHPADLVIVVPVGLLVLPRPWGRHSLAPLAVLVVVVAVVLAPWEVRNERAFHRLVPVSTVDGFIFDGVYNDQAAHDPVHRAVWRAPIFVPGAADLFKDRHLDEVRLSAALRRQATTYAEHHLTYIPRVVYASTVGLFSLDGTAGTKAVAHSIGYGDSSALLWLLSYYAIAVLAIVGLFRRRRGPFAVWLAPLLFVAVTVPTLGTSRYRAPIEPFLVLLAAVTISGWLDRFRGDRAEADARP